MRIEQLEAFVEVARRGSVSRAADALYATQPTLTARLKGLEQELDAKLFIRSQRGMRLSDAGRAFPSGFFYAIQKDAGGVYAHFQVPLPNLRLLFERERETEIGMR